MLRCNIELVVQCVNPYFRYFKNILWKCDPDHDFAILIDNALFPFDDHTAVLNPSASVWLLILMYIQSRPTPRHKTQRKHT